MRTSSCRFLIVLLLLVQVGWFLMPTMNKLADPFRYEERRAAYEQWTRQQTPASRAVVDKERGLLYNHTLLKGLLTLALLLVFNGLGIYYFWNYYYGLKKTTA